MTDQTTTTETEKRDLYQEASSAVQRYAAQEGRDMAAMCADALLYDNHTERRDAQEILWEALDGAIWSRTRAALYLAGCADADADAWMDHGAEDPTTEQRAFYALLHDVSDRLERQGWDLERGLSPAEGYAVEMADMLEEDAGHHTEDEQRCTYTWGADESDAFRVALRLEMGERGWEVHAESPACVVFKTA